MVHASTRTVVVLLHGLGTTGAVWRGVGHALERAGSFEILAPDLPGHGAAGAGAPYSVGRLAAAVAASIPAQRRLLVAGHSLGGYVALALASGWFGAEPAAVLSLGAKLVFSAADRERSADIASRPARRFATRAEALARYRLVAGLPETLAPDEAILERGVTADGDGFRLATDPVAFGIVVPEFHRLLAATRCPVLVTRGEHDTMVSSDDCRVLGMPTQDLTGLGHNAHVEDPERVASLIASLSADAN